MKIHRSNLIAMLKIAIPEREKTEKENGYKGDSGLVAGTKDLMKHLEKGRDIEFYES